MKDKAHNLGVVLAVLKAEMPENIKSRITFNREEVSEFFYLNKKFITHSLHNHGKLAIDRCPCCGRKCEHQVSRKGFGPVCHKGHCSCK